MITIQQSLYRMRRLAVFAIGLWSLIGCLYGCSTYRSLTQSTDKMIRDFKAPDTDLIKWIGVIPLDNQVITAKQDMGASIDKRYPEVLAAACPELHMVQRGDPGFPDMLQHLPKKITGITDTPALIKIGKELGLSAIVCSRFYPIAINLQDRGYFWFRKKREIAWVSASTEIYDVETGAKSLDETYTREFRLSDEQAEAIRKGDISSVPEIEKAVSEILQNLADAVCNTVIRQPWKGYITGISEDSFTISAGSNSGLKTGRVLQVFGQGQTIQGAERQTFQLPGKNIGSIRITDVTADQSKAVAVSGEKFQIGDVVKTK